MRHPKTQPDKQLSKQQAKQLGRSLVEDQDLGRAIIYGCGSALLSSALWVWVVVTTGIIMSWYGLVVGALVGLAIRIGGKGVRAHFSILGTAVPIIACVVANFWSIYSIFGISIPASPDSTGIFVEASILEVAFFGTTYVDVAMWIIAGGLGGYLSKRPLDRQQRFALSVYDMSKS